MDAVSASSSPRPPRGDARARLRPRSGGCPVTRPGLVGVHHLKLPVSDLEASIVWYQRVLSAQHLSKFDHVDSSGTRYAANSGSA
jgi:hypothetical protein